MDAGPQTNTDQADTDRESSPEHRSYPIAWVLPVLLAVLVIATVTPILATTYFINTRNAGALLSARAELLVDGIENQVRGLPDPVPLQPSTARPSTAERHLHTDCLLYTSAAADE